MTLANRSEQYSNNARLITPPLVSTPTFCFFCALILDVIALLRYKNIPKMSTEEGDSKLTVIFLCQTPFTPIWHLSSIKNLEPLAE